MHLEKSGEEQLNHKEKKVWILMEGGGLLWELVQVKLQLRRLHKTLIESSRLWP